MRLEGIDSVLVGQVEARARLQEQRHAREFGAVGPPEAGLVLRLRLVALAVHHRQAVHDASRGDQRRALTDIRGVNIGARLDEEPETPGVPVLGGQERRGLSLVDRWMVVLRPERLQHIPG